MSHLHRHYHNHDVMINEHRSPTDQSVKILRDMELKAMDNVLNTVTVDNNIVKAKMIFYSKPKLDLTIGIRLCFDLNGKEFKIDKTIDELEWTQKKQDYHYFVNAHIKTLYEYMALAIAETLILQTPELKQ